MQWVNPTNFSFLISKFINNEQQYQQPTRQASYFQQLKIYPAFMCERMDIEKGNKVLLPSSAAHSLRDAFSAGPMIFCLTNTQSGITTNVGVLEFVAPEGVMYVPQWVFDMLICEEGQAINVMLQNRIPKGKFIKVQPHKEEFINLPDPRAVLETSLRNFTCITKGDTIRVQGFGNFFDLDVLEIKPPSNLNCICTINTDIEVDFAPPLDYVEIPKYGKRENSLQVTEEEEIKESEVYKDEFIGEGYRIDKRKITKKQMEKMRNAEKEEKTEYNPREHRLTNGVRQKLIRYFVGKGEKLKVLQKRVK